jgi:transposase
MFLRCKKRIKDGTTHRYWSVVENKRVTGGRTVQRQVLYLGEINDSQKEAWRRTVEVFPDNDARPRTLALFPEDRVALGGNQSDVVNVRLSHMQLRHPRQWGACWLGCHLYEQLGLDQFWEQHLPPGRKGTRWDLVLQTLVLYRLIEPGSEWRLHRHWFEQTALADLLGGDFSLVEPHKLYSCHDRLLEHKKAFFSHLNQRWKDLFNARFEVLLYDLTSTYFESDPPFEEQDKRKFGYSRDKRSDCVQVVIALVVTPEGFPLAYEVMSGNTLDKTTLKGFLKRIEEQYGKARRIWVMDRGIPTEEVLEQMRASDPPIHYLVGTPKGRLTKLEKDFLDKPWKQVRQGVEVKLLAQQEELYVLARSAGREGKERSMRRRQLKKLWARLKVLQGQKLKRDQLLIKLGGAKQQSPSAWRLVDIQLPNKNQAFEYTLNKKKLRATRKHEGRYLLRTNQKGQDPEQLWKQYIQLTQVEEAFKNLKGDLAIRPIHHQKEARIEAHIFIAFIAYCLHVSLGHRLKQHAPGLTPRAVLEKLATLQMLDVHLPTTDGREIVMSRHTEPEPEHQMILEKLKLTLPPQPPPKITSDKTSQSLG